MFGFGSILGLGPISSANSFIDPATLNLTGWWKVFTNSDPQLGSDSLGSSGAHDIQATGGTSTTSTSLNGIPSLAFSSYYAQGTAGETIEDFVNAGSFSIWILCEADSLIDDPGDGTRWTGNGILSDGGLTYFQVTTTTAGATLGVSGTGANYREVTAGGFTTGSPQLIQIRWDGITASIRINNDAWVDDLTFTNINDLSGAFRVGLSGGGQYFDGRIWEIGISEEVFDDNTFEGIGAYIQNTYDLNLGFI